MNVTPLDKLSREQLEDSMQHSLKEFQFHRLIGARKEALEWLTAYRIAKQQLESLEKQEIEERKYQDLLETAKKRMTPYQFQAYQKALNGYWKRSEELKNDTFSG